MKRVFSKEQMKNYILMYLAVVIVLVLFFFLNSALSEREQQEKKVFSTEDKSVASTQNTQQVEKSQESKSKIRLLESAY